MVEKAVSSAMEKLDTVLIDYRSYLMRGVKEQAERLREDLGQMPTFLSAATQKQATNNVIPEWISHIRQVAQEVEDVMETFFLKINTPRRIIGMLENCACFPGNVKQVDKLRKEIESIQARLNHILESQARVNPILERLSNYFYIQDPSEGSESRRPQSIDLQRPRLVPHQTDKDVVGLEKYENQLLWEAILNHRPGLSVARVTGMGGLGKSTLAREVYDHADIVARFDFRAWVVVSEEFSLRGVIMELLRQLQGSGGNTEMLPLEVLKGKLLEQLRGRQYFIVLDDVREQQYWDLLEHAFPDEQEKSSRLLVTSRKRYVNYGADEFTIELQPLDPNTSWQLFLKKSFIDDTDGSCPPELEDIGREIVRKCGGLPLAITMVGGLLINEGQSRLGWVKILGELNSYLSRSEHSVSVVLELSYHNLPWHLKSCFLCLGFFREDDTIRAEKLMQVWIALGLTSHGPSQLTLEEIASGYLDELINQNIVQIKDMTIDDPVEICQIHNLFRDLLINKSKEEIGFEILKEGIHSQSLDKSCHLAIYCSAGKFTSLVCPHIRSLFCHNVGYIGRVPSFNWKKLILLRILDFEGFGLWYLPAEIGTLIELRYLGLRNNYLKELPISLGCLVNLQVLDITENPGIAMPDIMWKLESLRHLYMHFLILDAPLTLHTLKNLRTLVCRNRGRWMRPKNLIEMTNLCKLDVWIREEEVSEFISSLANLKDLVCLKLLWGSFDIPILDVLSTLPRLRELELYGKLKLRFHDISIPYLSQLTLFRTEIDQDSMRELGKLPKLLSLNLKREAFVGKELVISDDEFPRLRVLCISYLIELRKIKFVGEGRGMPELKRLEIQNCLEIESLPEQLRSVQELKINDCPKILSS